MGKFNLDEEEFQVGKEKKSKNLETKQEPKQEAGTESASSVPSGLTGTRGRKGQKLPTMNMRFSPENYEYIRRESAVRGLSATGFVNWLIETYRSDPAHVNYSDAFEQTAKW